MSQSRNLFAGGGSCLNTAENTVSAKCKKWSMLVTHWNLTITLSILQGFHIWDLTMSNCFQRQVFLEHQFYHVRGTLKVYGFFTLVPVRWFTYVKGKNGGCSLLGERKIYKAQNIKNPSLIKTLPQNQVLTLQANINNYITYATLSNLSPLLNKNSPK